MTQEKIPVLEYFSKRLRLAMESNGLTQKNLESLSGVTQSSISAYLREEMEPKISVLYQLSATLGVSMEWLCGIDSSSETPDSAMPIDELLKARQEIARLKNKLRSATKTLEGAYTLAMEALKLEEE